MKSSALPPRRWRASLLVAVLLATGHGVAAQDLDTNVPVDPLRRAWFGDLHLHTSNSYDAAWGGARTTPSDAYRYAQGFPVTYLGREVKRRAPLDFLAVADHAEYTGVTLQILQKHPAFEGTNWYQQLTEGTRAGFNRIMGSAFRGAENFPELNSDAIKRSNWAEVVRVANQFNQPGRFTALVAFEWSDTPAGSHHHRVAVFRGPQFPEVPFSALDSRNPLDLWRYADAHRARGIDSVLIPHNPNLSGGLQFSYNGVDGQPMGRDYALIKSRNEGLVEVTQIKGTSETHPLLSPNDEFAGFEIIDHYVQGKLMPPDGSYVRQAYGRGLEIAERLGVNPFAFGLVGSSDFHSSTSATEEDNYTGALGDTDFPFGENAAKLLTEISPVLRQPVAALSASGIAGVWAEQNTRESIFAALKRKEVFATSGPRIQVRLFAGWDYAPGLVHRTGWVAEAYARGAPMGSTLRPASVPAQVSSGQKPAAPPRSPRFLVQALKDPDGANLDRIQIVKVWRAQRREPREGVRGGLVRRPQAGSEDRQAASRWQHRGCEDPRPTGTRSVRRSWPANGSIRSSMRDRRAVYYARVIEIPSPRWPTFVSVRNNLPSVDRHARPRCRSALSLRRCSTSPERPRGDPHVDAFTARLLQRPGLLPRRSARWSAHRRAARHAAAAGASARPSKALMDIGVCGLRLAAHSGPRWRGFGAAASGETGRPRRGARWRGDFERLVESAFAISRGMHRHRHDAVGNRGREAAPGARHQHPQHPGRRKLVRELQAVDQLVDRGFVSIKRPQLVDAGRGGEDGGVGEGCKVGSGAGPPRSVRTDRGPSDHRSGGCVPSWPGAVHSTQVGWRQCIGSFPVQMSTTGGSCG